MPDMPDDFVTIAQAANYLGISERQARRYAARLEASDRQETPRGLRVRWVALSGQLPDNVRTETTFSPDMSGQVTDNQKASEQSALVEQLQSEVAFLRVSLEREQETAKALAGELAEARKQSAVMFAAIASGRMAIPSSDNVRTPAGHTPDMSGQEDPYQNSVPVPTSDTLEGTPEPGRVETPPSSPEGKSEQPASQSRRWWQVWKR